MLMIPLRYAIPLVLVFSTLITVAVSHLALLPRQQERTQAEVESSLRQELMHQQETYEMFVRMVSMNELKFTFRSLQGVQGIEQAILVNPQDTVVASIIPDRIGINGQDALGSTYLPSPRDRAGHPLIIRELGNNRLLGYVPVCGWRPVVPQDSRCGYMALIVDYSSIREKSQVFYREQILTYSAASVIGMLLMFGLLHFGLTRRLEHLQSVVTRFRSGNIWVRPSLHGHDELSQLSHELAEMLEAISHNELELRKVIRVIEQSPAAVTIVDAEGRIEYANPAAWSRYGAPATQVGRVAPLFDYTDGDDTVRKALSSALSNGDEWDGEMQRHSTGDGGELLWDRITVHPLRDERGLITNFIISETDITEFKRASTARTALERQLRHVQKMETIGRLAGGVAHDFNNILTPIAGYAQMMLESSKEGSKNQHRLERILSGVRRARDLVSQLLVVSRKGEQDVMPVDLSLPTREAVDLIRASVPTSLHITFASPKDLWTVLADPSRIHQVVMNLCTNASQAIGTSAGVIAVTLENMVITTTDKQRYWRSGNNSSVLPHLNPGRYVRLTIEDNGPGMPNEVVERIFEPFFTTKKSEGGSGLGLSIVDGIISQLGGRVTVYSELGLGTAFRVYLPASDRLSVTTSDDIPQDVSREGQGEQIFLVDDETENLAAVGEYLRDHGYKVMTFADPMAALATIKSDPRSLDLLITDFAMPGLQGDQLVLEVKAACPHLPIIMISGFSSKVTQWNRESFGVDAFVPKPIDFSTLMQTIHHLLTLAEDTSEGSRTRAGNAEDPP